MLIVLLEEETLRRLVAPGGNEQENRGGSPCWSRALFAQQTFTSRGFPDTDSVFLNIMNNKMLDNNGARSLLLTS